MAKKFIRSDTRRHLRLGSKRRKLQKWRKPRGRHNKIRRKRYSYPIAPTPGLKKPIELANKIQGLTPVLVHNTKELSVLDKSSIAILARVGAKKKLELIKMAEEKKIKIANLGGKRK